MNERSSRSHSILTFILEKPLKSFRLGLNQECSGYYSVSKLYFVDLAGSEWVKWSKVIG